MDERGVANAVVALLGVLLGDDGPNWSVSATTNERNGWIVALNHPASHGLVFETGTHDGEEAIRRAERWLRGSTEIPLCAAAPPLEHGELVLGVRTLAQAFTWTNVEVRAVAFLMFEHEHLDEPETAWLAGYLGSGAPWRACSPRG